MGRKKNYDRDDLIAKAMELFREHGFASTSTEMLVEHLGVNRYSVYAEFGSKQALFDAALERYNQDVIEVRFRELEKPGAGLAAIESLLEFYSAAAKGPVSGKGCLLCNTAVELGARDPSGSRFVQSYFARLKKAFSAALESAQTTGSLRDGLKLTEEADFLTASVLGLFVMLRAKAEPAMIESAANVAVRHLEGLRKRA